MRGAVMPVAWVCLAVAVGYAAAVLAWCADPAWMTRHWVSLIHTGRLAPDWWL